MTDTRGGADLMASPPMTSPSSMPSAPPSPAAASSPSSPADSSADVPVRWRRIGPSALRVFPLALSGTTFGWTADESTTTAILDRFLELGGSFIDTADSYAGGRSEIMVGNWMRRRGARDRLTIATKIGKSADSPGLSARAVESAVTASLDRLGVSSIDVLYLHIDDESVPFEETLAAVDELIRDGRVRAFGGSHHTPDRLLEARIAAGQLGVAPMIALQNHYNLLHRTEFEGGLARVAAQLDLGVMPRFALEGGFLTGKYRGRADLERHRRGSAAARHLTRRGIRILHALDRVAADVGAPVATVSLAWLLSRPRVVAPVVSVSGAEQLDAVMAAPSLVLGRHHLTELDRASS
ncbi:aldo/keto reductase [Yonghaparkia sp. Soil809]|uniref:aldo/keto reductase n=1 Tax=Yonghaparkia sp. Soil809 TaxID=1736417 RepID=UPI0007008971|nr:aldo/keto reductase [Yonghaparkia sp. Soil809]KRF32550.1 alcohol dehydrogenase [Yonghaparkia sp. Soil809]